MRVFTDVNDPQVAKILRAGGVGILRTDTLYGIVARADDRLAVERIYKLKDRDEGKSPIVLIASTDQLFDQLGPEEQKLIEQVWPGKVSVIIPSGAAPLWLRRGNDSVAYRLPADETLRHLVAETGPLIAPSANPEGEPPAMSVAEAQGYFGDTVDFYIDSGMVEDDSPSRLLRLDENGRVERLR